MKIKKAYLIANTRSGKGLGAALPEQAQKICDELGIHLVVYSTASAKDEFEANIRRAVQSASEDDAVVIAAGGDGTIRGVAQEAARAKVRFAAVAIGTFNFFARNHNLPEDPEAALRLALTGASSPVRLGEINGHIFLINASIGLYAKSIREREQRTKIWGRNRIVVIVSTVVSLFSKQKLLHAEFESEKGTARFDTPMIFIGNNDLQLDNLAFKVADKLKENKLALILFKPVTRSSLFRILVRGFLGKIEQESDVHSFGVRELKITTRRKSHNVALDGEMFHMQSPFAVQVSQDPLLLVVPSDTPTSDVSQ